MPETVTAREGQPYTRSDRVQMTGGSFVPDEFMVPDGLVTDTFVLEPLSPQHNETDYAAWTASIEHIRATPGFAGLSWPAEMSLQQNADDLTRHYHDFLTRRGFTYTVLDPHTRQVIGCVYLYPPRRPGTDVEGSLLGTSRPRRPRCPALADRHRMAARAVALVRAGLRSAALTSPNGPRRRAIRSRPHRLRCPTSTSPGLRHRHPGHPATPVPHHRPAHPDPPQPAHRPPRPTRLLTRPAPSRPAPGHHRPLARRTHPRYEYA